jgi:hypothetical protein
MRSYKTPRPPYRKSSVYTEKKGHKTINFYVLEKGETTSFLFFYITMYSFQPSP